MCIFLSVISSTGSILVVVVVAGAVAGAVAVAAGSALTSLTLAIKSVASLFLSVPVDTALGSV